MDEMTKSRKWLLTINNPAEHNMTHEEIKKQLAKLKNLEYWCMCDEVGQNKTYHTHLFIYKSCKLTFKTLKNKFPSAHIDYCRGTCKENRDYIRKEGKYLDTAKAETNFKNTFEEYGLLPDEQQGRRNDLHMLYDMIKDGYSNYEILEENPCYLDKLDKIESCRQVIRFEQFKSIFRDMEVYYHFGKTGTGKTRFVMEKYGYDKVYRITDYLHPFDNYKGQDVVIFEEFRSSLRIQDMLNYLDGYPLDLPCRYNNKVACYTKVYIITNIALDEQYTDLQINHKGTWLAFLRRITAIKHYDGNSIVEYQNVDEYLSKWIDGKKWEKETNEKNPFTDKKDESKSICDQQMTWDEMELFANAQKKSYQ